MQGLQLLGAGGVARGDWQALLDGRLQHIRLREQNSPLRLGPSDLDPPVPAGLSHMSIAPPPTLSGHLPIEGEEIGELGALPRWGGCRARGLAFDKPEDRLREAGGVMPATPGENCPRTLGMFHRCHARRSVWPLQRTLPPRWEKSGSGAHGRAFLVVIRGAASAPRRCSCPSGGRGRCPWSPSGPGLGGSSPSSVPLRHQPGTVPATFARFASRVPVQEMRKYRPG